MDREVHSCTKLSSSSTKFQRVKAEESFVSVVQDVATEAQHLLAEPKADNVVDEFLYFGGTDFSINQEQYELGLGVLDGLLDDIDEVDDIDAANDISGACKDFLLDTELAMVCDLDCIPYQIPHLGHSGSESLSTGCSRGSGDVLGLSESSTGTVLEYGSKNGLLARTVIGEGHDLGRDKLESQALDVCNLVSASHDLENLDELDTDTKPLTTERSSGRMEGTSVLVTGDGAFPRRRRLHKPSKRYIELCRPKKHLMERQCSSKDKELRIRSQNDTFALLESFRDTIAEVESTDAEEGLDLKLKPLIKRQKTPSDGPKDKFSKLKSEKKHNMRALASAPEDSCLSEAICPESCEDVGEVSRSKTNHIIIRCKLSSASSRDQKFKTRSQHEIHCTRAPKSASMVESISGTSSQAPSKCPQRRGRPKKTASKSEDTASKSEDSFKRRKSKKHNDRRKHQRMWTLEEVTKLIDGIAQYGTGRWTSIKRIQFSSSSYRTPVDLRDKWRNLLRASYAEKQKWTMKEEDEDEETQKHSARALPTSVLHRVRELASTHPYPKFCPGRYIHSKH